MNLFDLIEKLDYVIKGCFFICILFDWIEILDYIIYDWIAL